MYYLFFIFIYKNLIIYAPLKCLHTDPAEIVLTVMTLHMIASAPLHNRNLTIRTWLGMFPNPLIPFLLASFKLPAISNRISHTFDST